MCWYWTEVRVVYLFSNFYVFCAKIMQNDQRGYTSSLLPSSFKSASDQLSSSQNGYEYFIFGHLDVYPSADSLFLLHFNSSKLKPTSTSSIPPQFRITMTFSWELSYIHGHYHPWHSHPTLFQVDWWVERTWFWWWRRLVEHYADECRWVLLGQARRRRLIVLCHVIIYSWVILSPGVVYIGFHSTSYILA